MPITVCRRMPAIAVVVMMAWSFEDRRFHRLQPRQGPTRAINMRQLNLRGWCNRRFR